LSASNSAHQWGTQLLVMLTEHRCNSRRLCYFRSIRGSDAFAYRRTICGHGSGSRVAQLLLPARLP
jgi:hypothetical protein